jgi:hypothetical protein
MRRPFAAAAFAFAAAGCAVTPNADVTAFAGASGRNSFEVLERRFESREALALPLVHDRQTAGPSCGAHALASIVNYWRGPGALAGAALYQSIPPQNAAGYSMAELVSLAQMHGLLASAVRLPQAGVIAELERGRPVLLPVRLPSIYVQQRQMPGGEVPVLGFARNALIYRAAKVSEAARVMMIDHYLVAAGYEGDTFAVMEPVMGYRTIRAAKLARYRAPFGDAAIVFSGPPRPVAPPGTASAARVPSPG